MKKISVIISTFNRQEKVLETIQCFSNQSLPNEDYEIIVVDNGSTPALKLPDDLRQNVRLIRFDENQERSISRSTGAKAAESPIIIFSDDDMIVQPDHLLYHLQAHKEWTDLLAIGKVILPPEKLSEPGILFRQNLEKTGIPEIRGLVSQPNFATAQNMSIERERFLQLNGFDPKMAGIEDQEFAMRHSQAGGKIAFLPEAVAVHNDDWLDFLSFCQRQERGAEWTVPFSRRYPEWTDTKERELVNGYLNLGKEPLSISTKKIIKSVMGTGVGKSSLIIAIKALEKISPKSKILNQFYSFMLGVYLQKGYRRGIKNHHNGN